MSSIITRIETGKGHKDAAPYLHLMWLGDLCKTMRNVNEGKDDCQ